MTLSVCIKCGALKKRPIQKCPNCHFMPQSNDDKAKSLVLSSAYEIDGSYCGKSINELKSIAKDIQEGKPYLFNGDEISNVITYAQKVMNIPAKVLIYEGIKWIGPPVLLLLLAYLVLLLAD